MKSDLNGIIYEHKRFLEAYDGLFGLGMSGLQSNKMYDLLKANQMEEQFSLYLSSDGQSQLFGGNFDKSVLQDKATAITTGAVDPDAWIFSLKGVNFAGTALPEA
jgi:hypothetical protein